MPAIVPTVREEAFTAFHEKLKQIVGFVVHRNLDRQLQGREYPAVVMYDGADDPSDDLSVMGAYVIETDVTIRVIIRNLPEVNVGPAINNALGQVRQCIGSEIAASGQVWSVRYRGTDGIEIADEPSGDVPTASTLITFIIVRQESESDPYSVQ